MNFWDRVRSYRFDPFFIGLDGVPFVAPFPRVLPRFRCWVLALWFASWDVLQGEG